MSVHIAYVIAAWSGNRRYMHPEYKNDRTYFLRRHLERLDQIKHSLSHVAIVLPRCSQEPGNVSSFLKLASSMLQSAPLSIIRSENQAGSYGSYTRAFERLRKAQPSWTHYFTIEDDYLPCIDHFDDEFLTIMNGTPRCGAVFSYVDWRRKKRDSDPIVQYASVSNGLILSEAMEKAYPRHKKIISWKSEKEVPNYDKRYQIRWTNAFKKAGYEIIDVRSKFRVRFYYAQKDVYMDYNKENEQTILEAI